MAWPFDNQVDSVLPIDYGVQQLAKYANQNWFPNETETTTDIQYPGDNPVYPGATQPRVPDWISSPSRPAIPERTGIMRNIWQGTKDLASQAKGVPLGLLNLITRRQGADQSFGGYPGSGFGSRAGLFPQEVANLEQLANQGLLYGGGKDAFGTNVVSQFGDYNKHMAGKKAQFEAKLQDRDYLSTLGNPDEINTLEDLYNAYRTKYGKNAAIAKRLNHYANWTNRTGTAADKITSPTDTVYPGDRGTPSGPVTTGGGGTFDPVLDQRGRRVPGSAAGPSWRGATAAREALSRSTGGAQGQVAGPGFGRGAYWAKGGRVGLYAGGDPDEPAEDIFEVIQDQGIPVGEQVEGNPFQMRIEELMGKGMSYDDAYDIAEMEFQDLFAEGPDQDQGLASLV